MNPAIEFYLKDLNARIAKHEGEEKLNVKRADAIRAERKALAIKVSGVRESDVSNVTWDGGYRNEFAAIVTTKSKNKHISTSVRVHSKHPGLAAINKRLAKLGTDQSEACDGCRQLRALIDTKGVNGFTSFLRSRHGKAFTVADAKAALPDWLRLRAPAICPTL